ncbi:hypothetical protein JHK82_054298 [Glycine max]|nr:hypothetical protein JHK85_055102 [Glycine max]KAG5084128.1 hypothetical protein JHK84_054166 [Glycine max]KAG5086901.1 hypothetical protein JHK82_054298 [Glycine max]
MAFKNLSALTLCVSLVLPFLTPISIAANNRAVVPPETICNSTVNPSFCKTVLVNQNGSIVDYGRISVRKSLSQSRKFLNSVNSFLQGKSTLSLPTIRALEDCQFLAELNFEYLSNALDAVDKVSNVLPTNQAEDQQTLLSAVLTNEETCLEGLQQTTTSDQRVKSDLISSLSNDKKLHSVSLGLFTKGWVPEKKISTSWKTNGRHLGFRNGRLPLKMSNRVRAIYDSARGHGRKLLQDNSQSVLVRDIVVVSQDGSGNFTTINDAIAAAPNNTVASDGYFLIFVTQAQGRTDPNQNTGTSIHNATIKPAADLAPSVGIVKTYLGRPWKEYSRTVYMQSFMDSFINPSGWREWSGDFALSTLYYAEYNNTGPGSNTTNRVTWPGYHVINATDAANFTVSNFLDGDNWLPQTGVPYISGLI